MTARPFDLSATPAQRQRRTRWMMHLIRVLLPQDLTAEDRIAILAVLLGREVAQYPREQWLGISAEIGNAIGAACDGAADARATGGLALMVPAGRA